jgi:hypothetical protein
MSADLQPSLSLTYEERKFSLASLSSTCPGETSSEKLSSDEKTSSDEKNSSDDKNSTDDNFETNNRLTENAFTPSRRHSAPDLSATWRDQNCESLSWNFNNTMELQKLAHVEEDDMSSPFPASYLDRNDMPSTREPSPEPLSYNANKQMWNEVEEYLSSSEENRAHGHHGLRTAHTLQLPVQRGATHPPAHPYPMMMLVPKPMFVPSSNQVTNVMFPVNPGGVLPFQSTPTSATAPMPRVMPNPGKEPSPTERRPSMPQAPAPEKKEQRTTSKQSLKKEPRPSTPLADAPEKKEQKTDAKKSAKAKGRGRVKGDSIFDEMSADQKEALCKYIYGVMKEKNFTSADGYLIVDVFNEVWKDLGTSDGGPDGWRIAQHRFADLIRSAPQYFRLFRRSIRVANHCGWFARKGERMVRLVLEEEEEEKK